MQKVLTENKTTIIAGVILIALIAAYFKRDAIKSFFDKSKRVDAPSTANTQFSTPKTPVVTNSYTNDTVLKKGSKGQKVKELQILINKQFKKLDRTFWSIKEDGIFGTKTQNALNLLFGKDSISINQFKALV